MCFTNFINKDYLNTKAFLKTYLYVVEFATKVKGENNHSLCGVLETVITHLAHQKLIFYFHLHRKTENSIDRSAFSGFGTNRIGIKNKRQYISDLSFFEYDQYLKKLN